VRLEHLLRADQRSFVMNLVRACIPLLFVCGLPLAACGAAPVDDVSTTESATKVRPRGDQHRYSVEIAFAEAAEYPDARPINAEVELDYSDKGAAPVPGRVTYDMADDSVDEVTTTFRYGNPPWAPEVFVVTPMKDRSTKVPLYRIDVADPVVTRHDGSEYSVKGKFRVYGVDFQLDVSGAPTNHGLWVPAGRYTVTTTFTDENGDAQEDAELVSFGGEN
jgi:hypothetical protein